MYQVTYDFLLTFFEGYANTDFISDLAAVFSTVILGAFVGIIVKCISAIIKRCSP